MTKTSTKTDSVRARNNMMERDSFCAPDKVTVSDSIDVSDIIGNGNNTNLLFVSINFVTITVWLNSCPGWYFMMMLIPCSIAWLMC